MIHVKTKKIYVIEDDSSKYLKTSVLNIIPYFELVTNSIKDHLIYNAVHRIIIF